MISDKDLGMVETHPEIEIGHGQGEEISIEVILDKDTETGVTQEIGHGPEEETERIEVMIDNTEVETGVEIIIEILETIGIETIGTLDQTEVTDQEAIIEKDIMVTIIEGLTIVRNVNTPCPHESIQSMQDSINLIMDESCNLLDLQDTYKDSLNF